MKPALSLRVALMANAIFSLTCALFMLVYPAAVGEWLGIQAQFTLQVVGIGLLAFAAELIFQATRRRIVTWRALLASAADFSWVAGSIVLLLVFPQLFSPLGTALVFAVAGAVFVFGAWQLWAAGRAHSIDQSGEYRHCIVIETNVLAEKMWRVVGNFGDIQSYMPSLKRSMILDGKAPGVGVIRACEDRAGKQWSEECIAFEPGRSFAVRFVAEAPDFPFPARSMRGGWEVTPSNAGSQVMVWWELTLKSKLLAPIILPLLAFRADSDFAKIIRRMAIAAEGETGAEPMRSNGGVFARLVPSLC